MGLASSVEAAVFKQANNEVRFPCVYVFVSGLLFCFAFFVMLADPFMCVLLFHLDASSLAFLTAPPTHAPGTLQ